MICDNMIASKKRAANERSSAFRMAVNWFTNEQRSDIMYRLIERRRMRCIVRC